MTETVQSSASVEGRTYWQRSKRDTCACCPGRHVFARGLDLPEDTPHARLHSGERANIRDWVNRQIREAPEGARMRVTVEVLDD